MTTNGCRVFKASHGFNATNNDELTFNKDDIITVTQIDDGGWWEGTLRGKTGWFPSNYVAAVTETANTQGATSRKDAANFDLQNRESTQYYHSVVLNSIIDSERIYVEELQKLLRTYLQPLKSESIIPLQDCNVLCCNLEEMVQNQKSLLQCFESQMKLQPTQQHLAGEFMKKAADFRQIYEHYASNHPRIPLIITSHKQALCKFLEQREAAAPGTRTLSVALSLPFRRLEKYPTMLRELERHIDESHVDRGDTQRAIAVYKDIAESCFNIRKQKETEVQILTSPIAGWEGEPISSLGPLMMLSSGARCVNTGEHRHLVLFSHTLLLLSTTHRMSGFTYKGKIPLSGLKVLAADDRDTWKNILEITGEMIEDVVLSFPSRAERDVWRQRVSDEINQSSEPGVQSSVQSSVQCSVQHQPAPPAAQVHHLQVHLQVSPVTRGSLSSLRPHPPARRLTLNTTKSSTLKRRKSGRSKSEDDPMTPKKDDSQLIQEAEEDGLILKVIESYCTTNKGPHTVNSDLLDSPQVLVAEDEKMICDGEERSLVDTVYGLKDDVAELTEVVGRVSSELEQERRARKRLEAMLRKSLKSLCEMPWSAHD